MRSADAMPPSEPCLIFQDIEAIILQLYFYLLWRNCFQIMIFGSLFGLLLWNSGCESQIIRMSDTQPHNNISKSLYILYMQSQIILPCVFVHQNLIRRPVPKYISLFFYFLNNKIKFSNVIMVSRLNILQIRIRVFSLKIFDSIILLLTPQMITPVMGSDNAPQ